METLFRNTTPRKYEDFDPPFDWHVDEGSHTLVVGVEGYTKDQIDLWLDGSENLNITGERPLYNNRWRRIKKIIRIPENCDIGGMGASLEDGVLRVLMPKLKVPIDGPDEISKPSGAEEVSTPQKPESEAKSQMGHDDKPQKDEMARNSVDWEERKDETMEKVDGHQRVKPEGLATNLAVAALIILGFGLFISYKMGS